MTDPANQIPQIHPVLQTSNYNDRSRKSIPYFKLQTTMTDPIAMTDPTMYLKLR
jgi:hypothetical protein